jgi:polysaccharide biosynthesis transport protein
MDQIEQQSGPTLHGWWLRLCHRRLWVALSIVSGWAILTAVAWFIPARYRSETLILVEQQRVPEHYVEPNVALDLQQRLQSMSEQILSRTRLMAIIDKFHLYNQSPVGNDVDSIVERMRSDISIDLVKADGTRTNQIAAFKISYSAATPTIAQQVTAELTSLFIEENLRNRQQLSEDTTTFLVTELDEARKNLDLQEQRLREFKSRYVGQLPEQTTTNLQILGGLQARLSAATDALHQAQQQKLYLQSLLNNYRILNPSSSPDEEKSAPLQGAAELDQRLDKLKSQLAELSAKYTPLHPDIVRLNEEIATTEKLRMQTSEQAKSAKNPGSVETGIGSKGSESRPMNPAMQIESQLKANEFEIGNRNAEISNAEKQIDSYQQRLNLAPAREQELAAITRDHDQSRTNYDSLLAKKNQSEMATNLEKRQQGEQFRMIDPASLPQRPYYPKRLQFSAGGLGLGLVFGLGIVLLFEFVHPRIYAEQELRAIITAPLFITVPPIQTAGEYRTNLRRRVLESLAAVAMLLIVSAATLVVYHKH